MKQPKTPTRIGPLLLLALIGAAVLALFAATSAVSALDATRVDLPEVALPLVKCDGFNSCRNIVDLSQVADGSCNGTTGCYHSNPYTGMIGAGSCTGNNACFDAAGPIGAGSCNSYNSCAFAAGSIGAGSCVGLQTCRSAAGSISAGSCNGDFACNYATGSIGAGSCIGTYACYTAADSIGNNSCNTTGTACQGQIGNSFPVGDCQRNDVAPAACIVPRAYLPLMQR